jgi:hypothetical protein
MAKTAELSSDLEPGEGIFFMKVGTHAGEPIEDIVERKRADIARVGYAFWGYGGSNCHPLSVQPFADELQRDGHIRLLMEETHSSHFAVDRVADQFSVDGVHWDDIPAGLQVKGSRYALLIDSLEWEDIDLPLSHTEVAMGPSSGRRGDAYVTDLIDKACLRVTGERGNDHDDRRKITLVATVKAPFAVFVREKPEIEVDPS